MTPVYGWVCLMPVKKEKKKKGVLGSAPTLLVYRGKRFYIWTLSNQLASETSLLVIRTVATAMTFNRGNGYSRRKDFQRFSNLFFTLRRAGKVCKTCRNHSKLKCFKKLRS